MQLESQRDAATLQLVALSSLKAEADSPAQHCRAFANTLESRMIERDG